MAEFVETLLVGVKFEVDNASLQRTTSNFRRAAKGLKDVGAGIGKVGGIAFGRVASGMAQVGGAAVTMSASLVGAGVAIAGFGISQAISQDALAKMAAALNTTTEELSALEFAADRSGISSSACCATRIF